MGPLEIVVVPPIFDDLASVPVRPEQAFVQALISQPSVEGFHEAAMHRLTRRDVVPSDTAILLPGKHRIRGELYFIVTDHHAWITTSLGDGVRFTINAFAQKRVVDNRAGHSRLKASISKPTPLGS